MRSSSNLRIKFRSYVSYDHDKLIEVVDNVCAEGLWMRTIKYEPTPAWEHALSKPECECHLLFLALDQRKVIGWCRVFPNVEKEAEIGIGLLSRFRDQGIGSLMVQFALDWAIEHSLLQLKLWTRLDNRRAIHVFEKFNFEQSGFFEQDFMEMRRKVLFES